MFLSNFFNRTTQKKISALDSFKMLTLEIYFGVSTKYFDSKILMNETYMSWELMLNISSFSSFTHIKKKIAEPKISLLSSKPRTPY